MERECSNAADEAGRIRRLIGLWFGGNITGLLVQVRAGGLVLRGRCKTAEIKRSIEEMVRAATSLEIVANELEVVHFG